jgi:hypothetical protein
MSRNFPTALAALAHRAEGQCLFEGHTLMMMMMMMIIQFSSIQFFIFYVLSQQLQGQLQTQHSTEI